MPCNCGKKRGTTGSKWVYTSSGGQSTTYNTEVEAKAAMIRAGGSGSVRPA